MHYHYQPAVIHQKFHQTEWFGNTLGYGLERYLAIEKRMIDCFRYVACDSRNLNTFSYEFASIIRDIGSVFGSTMKMLVTNDNDFGGLLPKGEEPDIRHYKKWLVRILPTIHLISFEINIIRANRFIIPFSMLKNESSWIAWWDGYNNLKHSDIDNYQDGNLASALFGLSALAGLICLMYEGNAATQIGLFRNFGYREPIEEIENLVLVYQQQSYGSKNSK